MNYRPTNLDRCPGSGRPTGNATSCPVCGAQFFRLCGVNDSPTLPEHARRYEPSATYYPRLVDYSNDPWLHALAQSGATEEQVIDAMAYRCRDLLARLTHKAELFSSPVVVIVNGTATEREACAKVAQDLGARDIATAIRARGNQ